MNEQELVKKVASLAKLGVDDACSESLAADMKNMISFAALSSESGCFAMSNEKEPMILRQDNVGESFDRALLLEQSYNANDEFFTVPRVVAGGDGNE